MHQKYLRIATRQSRLALWQATYVSNILQQYHPNLKIKLVPIITIGDIFNIHKKTQEKRKGLFIKELEYALLENRADIAVHSVKDVTIAFPQGLGLPIICKRDDPRDSFISLKYPNIRSLPIGATVGTSSLRRQCLLHEQRPDLSVQHLRGNIDTRLKKLHQGKYDAIILSIAALKRLSLEHYVSTVIEPDEFLPAIGQGTIGIECRLNDTSTLNLLEPLHHKKTATCITAERAINLHLQGYCRLPIAGYAKIVKNKIWLRALLGLIHEKIIIRSEGKDSFDNAEQLGYKIAKELLYKKRKYTIYPHI
ncbi:hydroxymethylbilane synthase [Blochmannia endosymbiont of Polyrhachis (Hedomyrma) turneri]|uniref:hydroxymethylbilane synthase n=1 Tax=Blochmannia endosymbiont of Polyrhachis (Hedomyrma) turneri TaxID=1505596 RepID=UPI00061A70FA|nr:hydroxymethylbilane synthase [Blochmannia endosymbiont of Polyrhachis (Hedomyrma) turneri]AKC60138.1 porphobilinogen deaminase [Blochmannia endosymbiont of Polyrhachis (Hedomyrma) turneri]